MKKLLMSSFAFSLLFSQNVQTELENLKAKLNSLEKQVKENKNLALDANKKVNPIAANNHLYWSYDLRTSLDYIYYKTKSNKKYVNNILSNRITLTGVARAAENLKATLIIEANNIFGMNSEEQYSPYQNVSWVTNETPDDTNIRVKQAFFNYHFGPENGLMFSAGRRPATEGFPENLIYNDNANSPLAHFINIEFDGFSFEISNSIFSNLSDKFSDWGTWLKFCAGRGYSSSKGKWPSDRSPAYSKDNLGITDFAGFVFVPYDDGQYALWTETVYAWNMKGYLTPSSTNMSDLGDYFGEDVDIRARGIGDGISDFLDSTTAFIDFALTKTMPYSGKQMQGSTKSKTGTSIWIGAQMPGIGDNDTWGFNYVHGTKYFRPMTYGEDTLVGSIAAVRGNAYDLYYNKQIIPHLTAGLRATYLNYNNSGSEGFFGVSSDPNQPDYVNKAYDIRAYIRYKF